MTVIAVTNDGCVAESVLGSSVVVPNCGASIKDVISASFYVPAMEINGYYDIIQDKPATVNSAISFLNENYLSEKIGSIGWCFGGGQSLSLALGNDAMDATVIYYGSLITDSDKLSAINWPVLEIFGELDQGISIDTVNPFENTLNELKILNEIHIYPGVNHAFANPSGDRYVPSESKDAWNKTLSFLDSTLK